MTKHQTFTYTLEGDETGQVRHTRSGKWLLDEPIITVSHINSGLNSFRVMPSGEIRYSCPCCGGDTKRQEGLCGRCLI